MINLDLTGHQRELFEAQLADTHKIRIRVTIRDRDEKPIYTFAGDDSRVTGGSVQVDSSSDITRSLSIVLFDEKHALSFEPKSPRTGAVAADNFVSVSYDVFVTEMNDWVKVPVFWGIMSNFSRNGPEVTIGGVGKEALGLDPCVAWNNNLTIEKGTPVIQAIRKLLQAYGEQRFDLPDNHRKKLDDPLDLSRREEPWRQAKKLAASIDRQLFYDAEGRAVLRKFPDNVSFTFHDGVGGTVLDYPTVEYDYADVRNVIEVLGKELGVAADARVSTKKGKNKNRRGMMMGRKIRISLQGKNNQVRAIAIAPPNHPLSPQSLAHNGTPRYLVETIEHPHIKRLVDASNVAERALDRRLAIALNVSFDSLPVPHLEEDDRVVVRFKSNVDATDPEVRRSILDDQRLEFQLREFTIPLTSSESMSIGFRKPVKMRG